MRRHTLYIGVLAALLLLAAPAGARMHAGPNMLDASHRLKSATVVDTMATSLAAAYSLRKVRSAYAGAALRVQRASDTTQQDIPFTAGGDLDTAAAQTFCAATTCYLHTWYDQSPLARHALGPGTTAATLVLNCLGTRPCLRSGSGWSSGPSVTPSITSSVAAVGKVESVPATCAWIQYGTQSFGSSAAGDNWIMWNGGGMLPTAMNGAVHSGVAVFNGASSVVSIDGVETAGAVPTTITAGAIYVATNHDAVVKCQHFEAIWWDAYAMTPAERVAVVNNQRNYWAPLPLDTFATPAAAYSMRRLKSTYAGPAIRLRRASDNAEQDIGFLGFTGFTGAPIDTAAAAAHCAATTCTVAIWYDQSGNARDANRAAANQPAVQFACAPNGQPCLRATSSAQLLGGPSHPVTLPVSLNGVAIRNSGAGTCLWPSQYDANNALASGAVNQWAAFSTGGIAVAAPDGAWHAGIGVLNGAASVERVDATEVTGTVTASTAASVLVPFWGADSTVCSAVEVVEWTGYGLTAPERAALTANQKSFWGF